MKTEYDTDADAMYITLREDEVDHTREVDDNTILDFNKKGEVIGIELLFVRERNPTLLKEFHVESVTS